MAIDDLLNEHEQSERVRDWLRQNGGGLIGGVILGLALIAGWQWWQRHRHEQQMQMGSQYQAAVQALARGDLKEAQPAVARLPDGIYATLAALDLAKAQVDAGQRAAAITTLQEANADDPQLRSVVQQRLARLLIDAGKAQQALSLVPEDSVDLAGLEVRGDAYAALGQREQARAAYAKALVGLDVGSPERNVVELKLSEVGGSPTKPEARS